MPARLERVSGVPENTPQEQGMRPIPEKLQQEADSLLKYVVRSEQGRSAEYQDEQDSFRWLYTASLVAMEDVLSSTPPVVLPDRLSQILQDYAAVVGHSLVPLSFETRKHLLAGVPDLQRYERITGQKDLVKVVEKLCRLHEDREYTGLPQNPREVRGQLYRLYMRMHEYNPWQAKDWLRQNRAQLAEIGQQQLVAFFRGKRQAWEDFFSKPPLELTEPSKIRFFEVPFWEAGFAFDPYTCLDRLAFQKIQSERLAVFQTCQAFQFDVRQLYEALTGKWEQHPSISFATPVPGNVLEVRVRVEQLYLDLADKLEGRQPGEHWARDTVGMNFTQPVMLHIHGTKYEVPLMLIFDERGDDQDTKEHEHAHRFFKSEPPERVYSFFEADTFPIDTGTFNTIPQTDREKAEEIMEMVRHRLKANFFSAQYLLHNELQARGAEPFDRNAILTSLQDNFPFSETVYNFLEVDEIWKAVWEKLFSAPLSSSGSQALTLVIRQYLRSGLNYYHDRLRHYTQGILLLQCLSESLSLSQVEASRLLRLTTPDEWLSLWRLLVPFQDRLAGRFTPSFSSVPKAVQN